MLIVLAEVCTLACRHMLGERGILLAVKHLFCRFYVDAVKPDVYWYCPVLVVLAGVHPCVASLLVRVLEREKHWMATPLHRLFAGCLLGTKGKCGGGKAGYYGLELLFPPALSVCHLS